MTAGPTPDFALHEDVRARSYRDPPTRTLRIESRPAPRWVRALGAASVLSLAALSLCERAGGSWTGRAATILGAVALAAALDVGLRSRRRVTVGAQAIETGSVDARGRPSRVRAIALGDLRAIEVERPSRGLAAVVARGEQSSLTLLVAPVGQARVLAARIVRHLADARAAPALRLVRDRCCECRTEIAVPEGDPRRWGCAECGYVCWRPHLPHAGSRLAGGARSERSSAR